MKIDFTNVYKKFFGPFTEVDELPHPNGHGLVGYRLPNGKFLSFEPTTGNRNTDADSMGAWERFVPNGSMAIHQLSQVVIARSDVVIPDVD